MKSALKSVRRGRLGPIPSASTSVCLKGVPEAEARWNTGLVILEDRAFVG